jgi:NDP-sugar pyrophosphorylase family protein
MNDPRFPAAILAGGVATRLRPLTEAIPKALVEIAGEPFLAHQLRLLREHGIERVVLCTGYREEMIEEWVRHCGPIGLQVACSPDGPNLLGTAGAIRKALPLLGECFFVLYGDSYLPCDYRAIQAEFTMNGKSGLMTLCRNEGQWDVSNVEFESGRILVYDKRNRTPRMKHIDYGLGVFRASAFSGVSEGLSHDLAQVYQELLAHEDLAAFEVSGRFYEIGSFAGIRELDEHLTSHREPIEER